MNWEFDEALDAELMMSDSATVTFRYTNSPATTVAVARGGLWWHNGRWSTYSPADTITVIEHPHHQRP